jgi:Glu-tRNA(Gln) amidotransferase subunit E-like FAD-binding protein
MPSDVFIAFVERKLAEHGIKKVLPETDQLEEAFRLFARGERIRQSVEEVIETLSDEETSVPSDLEKQVRAYLEDHPDEPWSAAVRHVVNKNADSAP